MDGRISYPSNTYVEYIQQNTLSPLLHSATPPHAHEEAQPTHPPGYICHIWIIGRTSQLADLSNCHNPTSSLYLHHMYARICMIHTNIQKVLSPYYSYQASFPPSPLTCTDYEVVCKIRSIITYWK